MTAVDLRTAQYSVALEGSPLGGLTAHIGAELAAGAVPCACPHPATATVLCLPSGLLGCEDCMRGMQLAFSQKQAPRCACCGDVPATRTSAWMSSDVLVLAHICDSCSTAGNAGASMN